MGGKFSQGVSSNTAPGQLVNRAGVLSATLYAIRFSGEKDESDAASRPSDATIQIAGAGSGLPFRTFIQNATDWQPRHIARSEPRHSMSGASTRASETRRDVRGQIVANRGPPDDN